MPIEKLEHGVNPTTETKRVVLAELSRELDPPTFWGVLVLPEELTIDDITPLYRQWSNIDGGAVDFPDWLKAEHGFGEEPAAYVWLDPNEENGAEGELIDDYDDAPEIHDRRDGVLAQNEVVAEADVRPDEAAQQDVQPEVVAQDDVQTEESMASGVAPQPLTEKDEGERDIDSYENVLYITEAFRDVLHADDFTETDDERHAFDNLVAECGNEDRALRVLLLLAHQLLCP